MVGDALAAQHGATMRLLTMQVPGQLLFSLASQLALILFAGATTALTVTHTLSVPEAVALIVVIARYLEPFTSISELGPALESTRATLDRIRAVLSAPVMTAGTETRRGPHDAPLIEFDRRHLRLRRRKRAGAGRRELRASTGHHHSDRRAVRFGQEHDPGADRRPVPARPAAACWSTASMSRRSTPKPAVRRPAWCFNTPTCFTGPSARTSSAGDPTAAEAQFSRAVALARVDELTGRLAAGADTVVGEAGSALSGGERQRVSIARALLKPAPILLVDEATSALDTENEAAVVDALTADPQSRTRVIVAHRLASIRHADRVLFLDAGKIVEDGTVDELLDRGWTFRRLLAPAARRRRVANPRQLGAVSCQPCSWWF